MQLAGQRAQPLGGLVLAVASLLGHLSARLTDQIPGLASRLAPDLAGLVGRRPGDPARVVAKVDRIHEGLGFTATHDLRSMVESAWAGWQLRHPA